MEEEVHLTTLPEIERMEANSWHGPIVAGHFGKPSETPPEFWGHRTVLLIILKVYEHVLRIKEIHPKEMGDLLKSLATNLKCDVNQLRSKLRDPTQSQPVTDGETQQFTRQLEQVVDEVYGVKLQGV